MAFLAAPYTLSFHVYPAFGARPSMEGVTVCAPALMSPEFVKLIVLTAVAPSKITKSTLVAGALSE